MPAARYIVRNNQFLHNRTRGILLQTSYGLVEGNTFAGQTMHALFLTTFPPEGPGAQNVTIAGNSISGGGVNGGLGAVVLSRERNVYGQPARNPPVHQNLILMDNRINDVPGPAFYISSANNVVLYRNTVRNTNLLKLENKWNGAGDVNFPVVINDASNVLLRRNAISAIPSGRSAVFVDKATATGVRISAD
jgi:Periplasmic copper-binding protein (NosD)